jgi:hypothetical protein
MYIQFRTQAALLNFVILLASEFNEIEHKSIIQNFYINL